MICEIHKSAVKLACACSFTNFNGGSLNLLPKHQAKSENRAMMTNIF